MTTTQTRTAPAGAAAANAPDAALAVPVRARGRGWAYAGAVLGGAVSILANVAHSYVPPTSATAGWSPQPGAVIGAVFWPVALFMALEILARTAWPAERRWVAVRWLGLLPVALVAAVVSYRHLSGLLTFYGEDPLTATVGPLAVDGLMVMATGALLATAAGRAGSGQAAVQPDAFVQRAVGQVGLVRPGVGRLHAAVQGESYNETARGQSPVPVEQPEPVVQAAGVGEPSGTQPFAGADMPDRGGDGVDDGLSRPDERPVTGGDSGLRPSGLYAPAVRRSPVVQPAAGQPVQAPVVRPEPVQPTVRPGDGEHPPAVQPVQPVRPTAPLPDAVQPVGQRPVQPPVGVEHPPTGAAADAPIDRARAAALAHRAHHGVLPSVSGLADAAGVARGTAATALKRLREQRPGLQIVPTEQSGTSR